MPAKGTRQNHAERSEERDGKRFEAAHNVVSSFGQALKKVALYLHLSEGLEQYFQTAHELLQGYHKKYGSLTLVVKPFDFFFDGDSVFKGDGQENSITYKLYSAGIRSFTFEKGIVPTDLVALGRLLLKSPLELREEDLASRLWREGIPHIAYLQIHSSEDAEGEGLVEGDDEEDLEQLHAFLKQQFASKDPKKSVNFRSFSAQDLELSSFMGKVDTSRSLFEEPRPMSPREIAYIREVVAQEETSLIAHGSELLFFLCKHAEHPDDLREIEETFHLLAEQLFLSFDFGSLAQLLDALELLAFRAKQQEASTFLAFRKQLLGMFLEEERLQVLFEYLDNVTLRERERNDVCFFFRLLGPSFHELLYHKIGAVNSGTTRIILLALFSTTSKPSKLAASLLAEHEGDQALLVDMLHVGREIPGLFDKKKLEQLLESRDGQIQRLALAIFIVEFPSEMASLAGSFFKNANASVLRSLFEVLCQDDERGAAILFEFVKSKAFRKLPFEDQVALFAILGRSQRDEFLEWFHQLLEPKSRFYMPRVDVEKRLAIKGLEAFGAFEALAVIQHHAKTGNHSKRVQQELDHAVTFYHLYIKAANAPLPQYEAMPSSEYIVEMLE